MNFSPEIYAELYRQSAFISALLAGFSFAFLAVILTSTSSRSIEDWTAGFAMAATAGLIVCALGWTFSAPKVLSLSLSPSDPVLSELKSIHRDLSKLFILSLFSFLISLGLSGWIRSRNLGIVSTVIALLAVLGVIWLLSHFVS